MALLRMQHTRIQFDCAIWYIKQWVNGKYFAGNSMPCKCVFDYVCAEKLSARWPNVVEIVCHVYEILRPFDVRNAFRTIWFQSENLQNFAHLPLAPCHIQIVFKHPRMTHTRESNTKWLWVVMICDKPISIFFDWTRERICLNQMLICYFVQSVSGLDCVDVWCTHI